MNIEFKRHILVGTIILYAVGLRMTMLQIYLYQCWTVAETQFKGNRIRDHVSTKLLLVLLFTWHGISELGESMLKKKASISLEKNNNVEIFYI